LEPAANAVIVGDVGLDIADVKPFPVDKVLHGGDDLQVDQQAGAKVVDLNDGRDVFGL